MISPTIFGIITRFLGMVLFIKKEFVILARSKGFRYEQQKDADCGTCL